MQDNVFGKQAVQSISFRCRCKLYFRKMSYSIRQLSMYHAVSSSYSNQSNGQVEACIWLVRRTMKNVIKLTLAHMSFSGKIDTNTSHINNPNYTPFKWSIKGMPLRLSRPPIVCDNCCGLLIECWAHGIKGKQPTGHSLEITFIIFLSVWAWVSQRKKKSGEKYKEGTRKTITDSVTTDTIINLNSLSTSWQTTKKLWY